MWMLTLLKPDQFQLTERVFIEADNLQDVLNELSGTLGKSIDQVIAATCGIQREPY